MTSSRSSNPSPYMDKVREALQTLEDLVTSIKHFKEHYAPHAITRAPVIDHFHPDDYSQRGIAGLTKFLSRAETERDYVRGLFNSGVPPKDLTTNSIYLVAVWDEFLRAKWPLGYISQILDLPDGTQVKLDVVADGGNEWIKINTIKESRLMAEFREQDSYINSDYDSDTDSGSQTFRTDNSASSRHSPTPKLSNSLIEQAESLVQAAKSFSRPAGLPVPHIKFILNRMEETPEGGYPDPRVHATFDAIRQIGVGLILGSQPTPILPEVSRKEVVPTPKIILDLSVIVALCCDSTHQPLPTSEEALDTRFRPLQRDEEDKIGLVEHTNVSRDLRDQLSMETEHPLIEEIQDRLTQSGYSSSELRWYITREVKDRIPGIVELIGGPSERARARALFGESTGSFWEGSRYEGRAGILEHLSVGVLDEDKEDRPQKEYSLFEKRLLDVCDRMLDVVTNSNPASRSTSPAPSTTVTKGKGRGRRSRNPMRPHTVFPPSSRLPSAHTLRTMARGMKGGMTILTNNRGAVGKVVREVGVMEGLPAEAGSGGDSERERAVVWVVNPSSLSEWRRVEVEETNRRISHASG